MGRDQLLFFLFYEISPQAVMESEGDLFTRDRIPTFLLKQHKDTLYSIRIHRALVVFGHVWSTADKLNSYLWNIQSVYWSTEQATPCRWPESFSHGLAGCRWTSCILLCSTPFPPALWLTQDERWNSWCLRLQKYKIFILIPYQYTNTYQPRAIFL